MGLMADSLDDLRKRKRDEENEQDTTDEYGLDVFDAENVDVGDLLEGGLVGKRARLDGEVDTAAFVDFD